jgi:hypothetical protein
MTCIHNWIGISPCRVCLEDDVEDAREILRKIRESLGCEDGHEDGNIVSDAECLRQLVGRMQNQILEMRSELRLQDKILDDGS